jgi:hypothetical protein
MDFSPVSDPVFDTYVKEMQFEDCANGHCVHGHDTDSGCPVAIQAYETLISLQEGDTQ